MSLKERANQIKAERLAKQAEQSNPQVLKPKAPVSIESVFSAINDDNSIVKTVKSIPLGSIYTETNIRELDQETVEKYAATYRSEKSAGNMPPIRVWQNEEGKHLVLFGHHRYAAQLFNEQNYEAHKFSHITASVITGERPADDLINKWRYQENKTQRGLNPVDDANTLLRQMKLMGLDPATKPYKEIATFMIGDELNSNPDLSEAQKSTKIKTEVARYSRLFSFIDCGYPDLIAAVADGSMRIGNTKSGAIGEAAKRDEEKRLEQVKQNAEKKALELEQKAEAINQEGAEKVSEIKENIEAKTNLLKDADEEQAEIIKAEIVESEIEAEKISEAVKKKAQKVIKKAEKTKSVSEEVKPKKESIPLPKDVAINTALIMQWACDQLGIETINLSDEPNKLELISVFKDRSLDILEEIKGE
jgi:hypothetical protein